MSHDRNLAKHAIILEQKAFVGEKYRVHSLDQDEDFDNQKGP